MEPHDSVQCLSVVNRASPLPVWKPLILPAAENIFAGDRNFKFKLFDVVIARKRRDLPRVEANRTFAFSYVILSDGELNERKRQPRPRVRPTTKFRHACLTRVA